MNIFSLAFILFLFRYLNRLSISIETTKFKTELIKLSSRLYSLIDDDKIESTDPHFIYLSNCLKETPDNLPQLNLGVMVYYAFKRRKETHLSYAELENQFAYNNELKSIFRSYTNASVAYFNSKNRATIYVFKAAMNSVKIITSLFHKSGGKSFVSDFKKRFKVLLLEHSRSDLHLG